MHIKSILSGGGTLPVMAHGQYILHSFIDVNHPLKAWCNCGEAFLPSRPSANMLSRANLCHYGPQPNCPPDSISMSSAPQAKFFHDVMGTPSGSYGLLFMETQVNLGRCLAI